MRPNAFWRPRPYLRPARPPEPSLLEDAFLARWRPEDLHRPDAVAALDHTSRHESIVDPPQRLGMRRTLHPLLKQCAGLAGINRRVLGVPRGVLAKRRIARDVAHKDPHAAVEAVTGTCAVTDKIIQHHVGRMSPGGDQEVVGCLQRRLALLAAIGIREASQFFFQIRAVLCAVRR